uniref:Putative receptor-mediated endocytosis n=1 Tax=Amblyomma parvum TaxID=251391 RepID=A0A023FYT9_AMBPA
MRRIPNPITHPSPNLRGVWYRDPLFKRYWRHYNSTLQWFQQHQRLMREIPRHSVEASSEVPVSDTEQDDSFEMPVTEDLIAFFEQSARHRKSLCSSKLEPEEEQNQPRRQEATSSSGALHHQRLYGATAGAAVRGMEVAMQLAFEHFADSHQAKHWPNIPLKL